MAYKTYKAKEMQDIKSIEDKYGLVLFRMGLTHLVDVGFRHFDDETVAEAIEQIMAIEEENKTSGKISIMTPKYQCDVVRCAAEIAIFSPWTVFAYIKKYVTIAE